MLFNDCFDYESTLMGNLFVGFLVQNDFYFMRIDRKTKWKEKSRGKKQFDNRICHQLTSNDEFGKKDFLLSHCFSTRLGLLG